MTKHLQDPLVAAIEELKVEITPLNSSAIITTPHVMPKTKGKAKVRMVRTKMPVKKSRLEKATCHLYDLEDNTGPERALNIDLGLYQMEDY